MELRGFSCGTEGAELEVFGEELEVFGVELRVFFCVELRGFWCGTERFLVLNRGVFSVELRGVLN